MAIPRISRANVLAAIARIQKEGVPHSRMPRRYWLEHEGHRYSPKYVISLAAQISSGRDLAPQDFGGGAETNSVLRRLGFSVIAFSSDARDRVETQLRSLAAPSAEQRFFGGQEAKSVPSRKVPEPVVGRVVVRGSRFGKPEDGEAMLLHVLKDIRDQSLHLKFLITPGGFVKTQFPKEYAGGVSWKSNPDDLKVLIKCAEPVLSKTLTKRVREVGKGRIDILTVGIDLTRNKSHVHAELVAVCELASGQTFWTGKSYPTRNQERGLVQIADLTSHLLTLGNEHVLVLGCHDLNMFSPRGWATQKKDGPRRKRCEEMRRLVCKFKPTVVIQHPHSTDTPHIWRVGWNGLVKIVGGKKLKTWASGIAYFNENGGKPRDTLDSVLKSMQGGTVRVLDFVTSAQSAKSAGHKTG